MQRKAGRQCAIHQSAEPPADEAQRGKPADGGGDCVIAGSAARRRRWRQQRRVGCLQMQLRRPMPRRQHGLSTSGSEFMVPAAGCGKAERPAKCARREGAHSSAPAACRMPSKGPSGRERRPCPSSLPSIAGAEPCSREQGLKGLAGLFCNCEKVSVATAGLNTHLHAAQGLLCCASAGGGPCTAPTIYLRPHIALRSSSHCHPIRFSDRHCRCDAVPSGTTTVLPLPPFRRSAVASPYKSGVVPCGWQRPCEPQCPPCALPPPPPTQ